MRRITCCECGKHYDYDQDEFCPKCGAYNSVSGHGTVADHARPKGTNSSIPSSGQLHGNDPLSSAMKNNLYSPEFQRATRFAARAAHVRGGGKSALVALVVVLAAILISTIATVIRTDGGRREPDAAIHSLSSAFQVAGKQVTLSNPRWADIPADALSLLDWEDMPEGMRILAVDIRVTTVDPELEHLAPSSAFLTCQDGSGRSEAHVWPEEQEQLQEEFDLNVVSLFDCEDALTLSGTLLYPVEADAAEGAATLSINEFGRSAGSRITKAVHTVKLDLSDLPVEVRPIHT